MRDFTLSTYTSLINKFKQYYPFQTLQEYIHFSNNKTIIIRHDVDRKPRNSLAFAKLEYDKEIKASYYFRVVSESYDENIIKQIVDMGHEIGYHYENMDTCHGDIDKAWEDFRQNLEKIRRLYPVKTICMHGSPLSKFDNRDLWKKFDYRTEGIIGEPYLDIDWNRVFYITDAGRSWNNKKVSIRDKVDPSFNIRIRSTQDIINKIKSGEMPDQIMLNIHPHNWSDSTLEWWQIFFWQSAKNMIKRVINKRKQ